MRCSQLARVSDIAPANRRRLVTVASRVREKRRLHPIYGQTLSPACVGRHILSMSQDSSQQVGSERRKNPRLRELVDEMLATIRAAAHVDLWTPQERASCEAEMARIMNAVREHAVTRDTSRDH